MKKWRKLAVCLLALLLTGCGFPTGRYVSVTPHKEQRQSNQLAVISAENYLDLIQALTDMIANGTESATINVSQYPEQAVASGMAVAIRHAMENDPIGAYAVEGIEYELGASAGQPAVAIQIRYRHSRAEIRSIHTIEDMPQAEPLVAAALEDYDSSLVLLVQDYSTRDMGQMVKDLAEKNPQKIMETPQVTVSIYGNGRQRVVELIFTYQTGRDGLRQMLHQVNPVFEAAMLYVSTEVADHQKFSQLYGFLMERFDYKIETSITPAYSLLHHGVGDSRAFAAVYAAMRRQAG
ncbi:MAG: hypothetical protein J6V25_02685, partial [Oscillospiraceae bacterium]|nr:hypothetical protein [Oscillospiraceae bacterium]